MNAPRDDDPDEPRFGSKEWDNRREQRRGHPKGDHVRPAQEDDPLSASAYTRTSAETAIVDAMMERLNASQPKKGRVDWSLNVPIMVTIVGMAVTVLVGYVQLGDRVESFGRRLEIVEKRQGDNMPKLDEQIRDNKLQDQRIQNSIDANSDERKARQDSDVETRKAQSDILTLLGRLTDRVNDLTTEQAVQKDRQRRGALATQEHDAQAVQGPGVRPR